MPSAPEVFEPARCQRGIARGAGDRAMPHEGLQSPGIDTAIDQRVAARMSKLVRMALEGQAGCNARALNHAGNAGTLERSATFGSKQPLLAGLALQRSQRGNLIVRDRVRAVFASLGPAHVQCGFLKIHVHPLKAAGFAHPQPMAPHQKNNRAVPQPVAVALRCLYQRFNLALQQVFAAPVRAVRLPRRHGFHDRPRLNGSTLSWPSAKHSPSIT